MERGLLPFTVFAFIDGDYSVSGHVFHVQAVDAARAWVAARFMAHENLPGTVPANGGGTLHLHELDSLTEIATVPGWHGRVGKPPADPEYEIGDHLTGAELEPEAGYTACDKGDEPERFAELVGLLANERYVSAMLCHEHDLSGVIARLDEPEGQPFEIWATTAYEPSDSQSYCLVWRAGHPMDRPTTVEDDPGADVPPAAHQVAPLEYEAALKAAQNYVRQPEQYNPPSPAQLAAVLRGPGE